VNACLPRGRRHPACFRCATGSTFRITTCSSTILSPATPASTNQDVTGNCSSTYIRNAFPGNVIPRSRISPIGEKILSYYPDPELPRYSE